jgi:uncharacterized RDD family membrane protein YckC
VRNLLRVVELLPPIWILGLVALRSRNRQRIGDALAHTLVVRSVRTGTTEEKDGQSDRTDKQS